jgi:hypothetical protein
VGGLFSPHSRLVARCFDTGFTFPLQHFISYVFGFVLTAVWNLEDQNYHRNGCQILVILGVVISTVTGSEVLKYLAIQCVIVLKALLWGERESKYKDYINWRQFTLCSWILISCYYKQTTAGCSVQKRNF